MNWVWIALGAGGVIGVQAALNARLGRELGSPAIATLSSFATGTVLVLAYCLVVRAQLPAASVALRVPPWAWFGGVLGAFYVAAVITTTPKLGAATMVGLTVAGQMLTAIILDHFGLLGLDRHPVSPGRILGMLLLLAGVVLLKRF